MTGAFDERALWLATHVLPHEGELRAWLATRKAPGLDIDDVVQETYARLLDLGSIEAIRDPRTYAFSAAQSVVWSHLRRAKIVSIQAVADADQFAISSPEASQEQLLLDREELVRLAEAIAEMPKKTQDVFRLRRIEGLPQRAIAERLGLPESTVEKHIARAIGLLMNRFGRGGKARRRASTRRHEGQGSDAPRVRAGD